MDIKANFATNTRAREASIPSLQDLAADIAASILRDTTNPDQGDASFEKMSHMMVNAGMAHPASLPVLFEYVATAHGLHQAADAMQGAGQADQARSLHDLGQLFVQYAITDIGLLMSDAAWRDGAVN
ncbi:MAG: hypothetical protein KKB66_18465 [Alphaproteobacteria bacterium]|uniref:Uncharacterized protein n=1 Tax=viral metagenome TaxID=1070528 RepID=A0A6H1ZGS3_9ZZZZ|nr:hypothetical protein [Alphaproteobacteria bacterium]MBU0803588.1 hypothetical protein [Alphaproteobacteria bacterium]MBU0873115.1 hypothetical protein [Alphaproteobacteria bacterium]MBU1402515.1 hypothetical protein [Alphaproteobacteria bacterium]MBU1593157.1 hypothetical protein [Alphaproteobacteria bacterium]